MAHRFDNGHRNVVPSLPSLTRSALILEFDAEYKPNIKSPHEAHFFVMMEKLQA